MDTTDRLETAELLGRLHNLPDKQKEKIWFVIDGMNLMNQLPDRKGNDHGNETEC